MTRRKLAAASLAAVLALCGAGTWGLAEWRAARAKTAYPPSGHFVEIEGRRIHLTVSGAGPDVVLIHGAFGSLRDFTFDLAARLEGRYRVIAIDRPGLGYSDHTDPALARAFAARGESPAEQSALLAAAVRTLGAERPIVVGHSFGGIVALSWALDHDPAALVLFAGVAMPWPGELGWLYQVNGTALGGAVVAPVISAFAPPSRLRAAAEATFAPQPAPDGYADYIGPYMPLRLDAFRATTRQVNTLRPHVVAMETRYPGMTLPIEILHGDADTTVPLDVHSRPFSALVKSANLTVLEGVGHMPHHADPEAAVAAIDRAANRAGLR